jgi:hypothetical protein
VDVIKYESALRTTIEKWIVLSIYKDVLNGVTATLGKEIEKQMTDMEYQRSMLSLLDELNAADALPALVFHFDRHGIECMAQTLINLKH